MARRRPIPWPRNRRAARAALLCLLAGLALASCSSVSGPEAAGFRSFAMGFTDFPYGLDAEDIYGTWDLIRDNGDMIVLHFDGGVPWQEALDGAGYAASWEQDLDFKTLQTPYGHIVYLAVTPINDSRNGLANYRGSQPNEPLPFPWSTYAFDQPDVVTAYVAHCLRMIEEFSPDYFAYAIEANMVHTNAPGEWDGFVSLAAATYAAVKDDYPDLPVFITFQADAFHADELAQSFAIDDVLPYTDMIAVSGYPFTAAPHDVDSLRADYFTRLAALAPAKPFAIAETSWPAEHLGDPFWEEIPFDEADQKAWVERIVKESNDLDGAFICWFFVRDYDEIYDDIFQHWPNNWIPRTWRDTGLFAGDGTERAGLISWRQTLARPLSASP